MLCFLDFLSLRNIPQSLYWGSVHIVANRGGSSWMGRSYVHNRHVCTCTQAHAWSHLICVLPSLKYRLAFVLGFPVLQSTCIHIRFMYWAGVQEWDQSTGHPMAVHHFIPRTLGLPLPKVTRLVLCQGSHSNWQPSLPTGSMVPSWCPPICRAPSVLSVPETHSIPVPDPVRLGGLWESKRQRPWTSLAQNHLNHRNLGAKNNIGWECILL